MTDKGQIIDYVQHKSLWVRKIPINLESPHNIYILVLILLIVLNGAYLKMQKGFCKCDYCDEEGDNVSVKQ